LAIARSDTQPSEPDRLAAGEEVAGGVEVVEQREVLVDGLDPEVARVVRRVDVDRLPVDHDLAVVGPHDAGEHLDQGRLAGAVVAKQRQHLAAAQIE